jgi:type IV pilus assembly protein PilA
MNCPYCAEPLDSNAQVCPHCQGTIAPAAAAPPPPAIAAPQSAPAPVYAGPTQPCGKATASLTLGIIGLVLSIVLIGIPLGIIAVILGHLALSEIKHSGGRLEGHGKAIAGLVTGYICVGMILLLPLILIIAAIAIPNLLRARMAANETSAVGSLRAYNTAIVSYETSCQRPPALLAELGPAPAGQSSSCQSGMGLVDADLAAGRKNGYDFAYATTDTRYELHADPVKPGNTGVRHFFTDESGIIRADAGAPATADSPPLD